MSNPDRRYVGEESTTMWTVPNSSSGQFDGRTRKSRWARILRQLIRHVARRGYPWEQEPDAKLERAASVMDEVQLALTYVEQAKRALLAALPAELAKAGMEWDPVGAPRLFDLYVLLVLVTGEATALKDVHDAWAVYTQGVRPAHVDLVPFGELSTATATYDRPFRDAIVNAAAALRRDGHA